jgi:hypothetical protein
LIESDFESITAVVLAFKLLFKFFIFLFEIGPQIILALILQRVIRHLFKAWIAQHPYVFLIILYLGREEISELRHTTLLSEVQMLSLHLPLFLVVGCFLIMKAAFYIDPITHFLLLFFGE